MRTLNEQATAVGGALGGCGFMRHRLALGLIVGIALGAAAARLGEVAIGSAAGPERLAAKDEARLSLQTDATGEASLAGCTALLQDRFTGLTIAVDCAGSAPRPRLPGPSAGIES